MELLNSDKNRGELEIAPDKASPFLEVLRRRFREIQSHRKGYSLRQFAKDIKTNHASLSHMLSGRRKITSKSIKSIGPQIGLSPADIQNFLNEIESQKKRAKFSRVFESLEGDQSDVLTDWHFDAILELTHLKEFVPCVNWIAKRLGMTEATVREAIYRLTEAKLLEIKSKTEWVDVSMFNTTIPNNSGTSQTFRTLQRHILYKSFEAIDRVPQNARDHSSVTMAIRSEDIPKAKALIRNFRRELCSLLQADNKNLDQVYQLSIGFFPLTLLEKSEETA